MKLTTLCYVRTKTHTLMLHRVKKDRDIHRGKWNGLGGKMEQGETPEECAIREIYEESGLTVTAPILKGLLLFPMFDGIEDWFAFVYIAYDFSGELRESDEGALSWIPHPKLLDLPLWAGDHSFLPFLDKPGFFSGKYIYRGDNLIDYSLTHTLEGGLPLRSPKNKAGPAPKIKAKGGDTHGR